MSAPPFMQMYWSDYFGDTRHLSCEQHGAYLQLLGSMWLADGSLPADPKKLAKITGCTASRWAKICDDILAFFTVDGDRLTHKRIGFELEKAREKSIKRAEAGSRGGTAKSLKTHEADVAIATVLPQHLPEPEPEKKDMSEPKGSSISPSRPVKVIDIGFDRFWLAYPRKVGKDAARRAYALAVRRIIGPDPPNQILDGLARARPGWIGVEQRLIPHPTTWLNRGSWDDEAPEPPQTQAMRPAHERPSSQSAKFDRHQANLERANAGAESAARYRAVKSQSCF